MGTKHTYPSDSGDFDKRSDILEYRIISSVGISSTPVVLWEGISKDELFSQLKVLLNNYAAEVKSDPKNQGCLSTPSIKLSRHFGKQLPESNFRQDIFLSEKFDFYIISLWTAKECGCVVSIDAIRGTKDENITAKMCHEEQHLTFEDAAKDAFLFLQSKEF